MRQAMALVLAICLALSGCAAPQQNNGPVTLTMWTRSGQDFVQQVVDGFNRTHPNIHGQLTVVPDTNFVQKLGVAVAGDAGPDLALIDVVFVPLFASSGVLADITDQAQQLPYFNQPRCSCCCRSSGCRTPYWALRSSTPPSRCRWLCFSCGTPSPRSRAR